MLSLIFLQGILSNLCKNVKMVAKIVIRSDEGLTQVFHINIINNITRITPLWKCINLYTLYCCTLYLYPLFTIPIHLQSVLEPSNDELLSEKSHQRWTFLIEKLLVINFLMEKNHQRWISLVEDSLTMNFLKKKSNQS